MLHFLPYFAKTKYMSFIYPRSLLHRHRFGTLGLHLSAYPVAQELEFNPACFVTGFIQNRLLHKLALSLQKIGRVIHT